MKRPTLISAIFTIMSCIFADYCYSASEYVSVIEAEVDDVASDYNNSVSSPIARSGEFAYWTYIANTPQSADPFSIVVHQVLLSENPPDSGGNLYPRFTYTFSQEELNVIETDETHTAPSVGVDRNGFIHVVGGMHHQNWEYCVSTSANSVTNFERIEASNPRMIPLQRVTYPRFFSSPSGQLYVAYRSKNSNYWHNGTTSAAIARYDENTQTWSALGSDDYRIGDAFNQSNSSTLNEPTKLFELEVASKWLDNDRRPEAHPAIFYSPNGAYHRFFRLPDGELIPNESNRNHAYQSFWQDIKFSPDGRLHACCIVRTSPKYSEDGDGSTPGGTVEMSFSGMEEPVVYPEESFAINYHFGNALLYAYSDDGGKTFFTPDGQPVSSLPLCAEPLVNRDGDALPAPLTIENGGVVYFDDNLFGKNLQVFGNSLSILPDGAPLIGYRISNNRSKSIEFLARTWDGNSWKEVGRGAGWVGGAAGGIVSDSVGNLFSFLSSNATNESIPLRPNSNGTQILFSKNGIDGTWKALDAPWRNGLRHDTRTVSEGSVLRYVDMDIQKAGTSRLISLRPGSQSSANILPRERIAGSDESF